MARGGGEDLTTRTLMAWVYFGVSCLTREDPRACWSMGKQMADDGDLQTCAQLEAQASTMGQAIAAEVEPSITTSEASFVLSFFLCSFINEQNNRTYNIKGHVQRAKNHKY